MSSYIMTTVQNKCIHFPFQPCYNIILLPVPDQYKIILTDRYNILHDGSSIILFLNSRESKYLQINWKVKTTMQ